MRLFSHSVALLVTLLVFISVVTTLCNADCSRLDSRKSHLILAELVYPLFESVGVSPSSLERCSWNPTRDMYGPQEHLKLEHSINDWLCTRCGKRFYSESAIDLHMDNRHKTMAYTGPHAVCFASFCPILRCNVLHPIFSYRDYLFWDEALCEEDQFSDLRTECASIVEQCVSGLHNNTSLLQKSLRIAVCDQLTCARYWDVPDSRAQWSIGWQLFYGSAFALGLLTCFTVIFIRSSALNTPRMSTLSSPHRLKRSYNTHFSYAPKKIPLLEVSLYN